jgi:hypothetical protein
MQRENHHLFPNTFYTAPLETWAAAIQRPSSEAKQCFLEQVVHYKALSDMEHEFLVVYASHPSGSKIVLGVDRNAQDLATALQANIRLSIPGHGHNPALNCSVFVGTVPQYTRVGQVASPVFVYFVAPESSDLAYDGVQVSHDGTPEPILAQHGPCVPLYTITFSSTSPPLTASTSTSTSTSNSDARRPPSLLHLSVLLLTIRTHFPSYDLLQYQCYFFARVTCLALMDLFGGVETELEEGKRAATWRGVHTYLCIQRDAWRCRYAPAFSGTRGASENAPAFSGTHIAVAVCSCFHSRLSCPLGSWEPRWSCMLGMW